MKIVHSFDRHCIKFNLILAANDNVHCTKLFNKSSYFKFCDFFVILNQKCTR